MDTRNNPVIRGMLNDLYSECPEIEPLVERWLRTPRCLELIHLLASLPHQSLAWPDVVRHVGNEDEAQTALSCLLEQGIVVRVEVVEAGMTFYRLADEEGEKGKVIIPHFRDWCLRARARLRAAGEVLGVGWHRDGHPVHGDGTRRP